MMTPSPMELVGALLFAGAVLHTFSTHYFERLAEASPRHAGLWHWLGEVEVVFGAWALLLCLFMAYALGPQATIDYLESRNYTEPLFVFAIMVMAATRPILYLADALMRTLARGLPCTSRTGLYFLGLALLPLLGSLITEPAAMTLAALSLRTTAFTPTMPARLKYLTLGVLFVNVSIGGTLTPFAAPPVLMVAAAWQWDIAFMWTVFGSKTVIVVVLNAGLATLLCHRAWSGPGSSEAVPAGSTVPSVPWSMVLVHLVFLVGVVLLAHHPVVFLGLLLFFLGFVTAYPRHQDALILRQALLVAFFLAGLVVLGGWQAWWLEPLLMRLSADTVFYGALALTAFTDNAALTYLATLVEGLSLEFKTALVSGAVLGGGLTVIANAPNPAGAALLKDRFAHEAIHPLGLLLAALPPTLLGVLVFRWL